MATICNGLGPLVLLLRPPHAKILMPPRDDEHAHIPYTTPFIGCHAPSMKYCFSLISFHDVGKYRNATNSAITIYYAD